MPTVAVFDMTGKKTGEMELNAAVFGIEPNMTVVHAAVKNTWLTSVRALSPR